MISSENYWSYIQNIFIGITAFSIPFLWYVYQVIDRDSQQNTRDQLGVLAGEVAEIFKKVATLPPSKKFGWLSENEAKQFPSWTAYLSHRLKTVKERSEAIGVVDRFYVEQMKDLIETNRDYFDAVAPTPYFDDIASKNIMINKGAFAGLVDLDVMSSGDPLDAVGVIKADWAGTHQGDFYTTAIVKRMRLDPEQRRIVTVYAALNRIFWLSEKGIQFNQNTSIAVDQAKLARDKKATDLLLGELGIGK